MSAYMKNAELEIAVDVGVGAASATMWTCDLTHGYISINGDYRSLSAAVSRFCWSPPPPWSTSTGGC